MFKKKIFQNGPFPAETQHLEEETCWLSFSSFSPRAGGTEKIAVLCVWLEGVSNSIKADSITMLLVHAI